MGAPSEGFDPLDPSNMSPLVVALCADEAQNITGQVFHVWGGAINALQGWSAGELFATDEKLGRRRAARRAARPLPRRRGARRDDRRHAGRRRTVAARAVSAAPPARRRIYLMRHAQVRYFRGEHPHDVLLTDAGRTQAAAAAEALREVSFDRVITSGLPRTLETARAIAPEHDARREPRAAGDRERRAPRCRTRGRAGDDDRRVPRRRPARHALPRRRDDRRAARPGRARARRAARGRELGRRRCSCCTAPSTARS